MTKNFAITVMSSSTLRVFSALVFFNLLRRSIAADPPYASLVVSCTDELVAFSSCLPYAATFPNNITDSPQPQCCDDISAAFRNGSAVCLCYLVLRPKILGFPLNSTKVLSLTSLCSLKDQHSNADYSIEKLCSGPIDLPPLLSITVPSNAQPSRNNSSNDTRSSLPPHPMISVSPPEFSSSPRAGEPDFIPPPAREPDFIPPPAREPDVVTSIPPSTTLPSIPTVISSATKVIHISCWSSIVWPVYIFAAV